MLKNKEITIRRANLSDIETLSFFFIKAYGKHTVFQDKDFLRYYFYSTHSKEGKDLSYSLIAINSNQEIISPAGAIYKNMVLMWNYIPSFSLYKSVICVYLSRLTQHFPA